MAPAKRPEGETNELRLSLVEHARQIVTRDGPDALTMRALAAEAKCATGLPYKVFSDRTELVSEILRTEMIRLADASEQLRRRAGSSTVAANLLGFAEALLNSPAVSLTPEVVASHHLSETFTADVHHHGVGPAVFETSVADYLAAEQSAGRVGRDIDVRAFGFVIAGAIHNLVMSGPVWPRPNRSQLRRHIAGVAEAITPRP